MRQVRGKLYTLAFYVHYASRFDLCPYAKPDADADAQTQPVAKLRIRDTR